jgi:hypothetical protein
MDEDRIQKLELKITELENKLKEKGAAAAAAPSNISPEDLMIYQKVSTQLGVCHVCHPRLCWPPLCICPCGPGFPCYPCACGPCIKSSGQTGNSGFSDFM